MLDVLSHSLMSAKKRVCHTNLASETWQNSQSRAPRPHCAVEGCQSVCNLQTSSIGTAMCMKWVCGEGHLVKQWRSQPRLRSGVLMGNFMTAAAVLCSGNNFAKIRMFLKCLHIGSPSSGSYHRMQGHYICPAIMDYWEESLKERLDGLRGQEVVVSGDGRMDSPGYCAKYCTYTMLDYNTKDILDVVIVAKTEVGGKSGCMEAKAFKRVIDNLTGAGIKVKEVITDAHPHVGAIMSKYNKP
jgi:hypothetical protein